MKKKKEQCKCKFTEDTLKTAENMLLSAISITISIYNRDIRLL